MNYDYIEYSIDKFIQEKIISLYLEEFTNLNKKKMLFKIKKILVNKNDYHYKETINYIERVVFDELYLNFGLEKFYKVVTEEEEKYKEEIMERINEKINKMINSIKNKVKVRKLKIPKIVNKQKVLKRIPLYIQDTNDIIEYEKFRQKLIDKTNANIQKVVNETNKEEK